jgi:hypothetical protein
MRRLMWPGIRPGIGVIILLIGILGILCIGEFIIVACIIIITRIMVVHIITVRRLRIIIITAVDLLPTRCANITVLDITIKNNKAIGQM